MPVAPKRKAYLESQTFVAFDTETTGLWAPVNRLVEIGAAKFTIKDGELKTFQQLINPERPMPAEVIGIHGITDAMVKEAPTVKPVIEAFIAFCGPDSVLLAHNAPFDVSFLSCELGRTGLDFGGNLIMDTVDIYHRLFPQLESYSLFALVNEFEIAQTQEHRALADARLVHSLFVNALSKFPKITCREDLTGSFDVRTISGWQPEPAELPGEYADLAKAIAANLRLRILYQVPGRAAEERIISVRQVLQLGSNYYLDAFCERAQADRTFRLDRVARFEIVADEQPPIRKPRSGRG